MHHADVLQVIAITGMGDHHRLDQPIAITGIRNPGHTAAFSGFPMRGVDKLREETKMPTTTHTKAAEHHETAAKAHRTAAEHHTKGDHAAAHEHSTKAHGHSDAAHKQSTEAHSKSSQHAKK